jgi:hypothetical protein
MNYRTHTASRSSRNLLTPFAQTKWSRHSCERSGSRSKLKVSTLLLFVLILGAARANAAAALLLEEPYGKLGAFKGMSRFICRGFAQRRRWFFAAAAPGKQASS